MENISPWSPWTIEGKASENISPWTIEQFTWMIKNFSKCDSQMYSDSFFLNGYPWRIVMNPKGNEKNSGYLSLSILSVVADITDFSKDWKIYVNLELALTNQANPCSQLSKKLNRSSMQVIIAGVSTSSYIWMNSTTHGMRLL